MSDTPLLTSSSFQSLFETIWNSLDDILLCIGLFMIARIVAKTLKWSLYEYFDTSKFVSQIVEFLFMTIVNIFLISHLCSQAILQALFGGISIGVGYAFQPYIISFFTGMMIRAENVFGKNDQITIQDQSGEVEHIGMFYTHLKNGSCVPNAIFQNAIFSVKKKDRKCED